VVVVTCEVPANNIVSYGKKPPERAIGTFDSWFFTNSRHPLMGTSGRIASAPCLTALEAARVDVFATVKQRPEEADFGLGWRKLIHAGGLRQSYSDRYVHEHILQLHHLRTPTRKQLQGPLAG
jgi:hypothetical protein